MRRVNEALGMQSHGHGGGSKGVVIAVEGVARQTIKRLVQLRQPMLMIQLLPLLRIRLLQLKLHLQLMLLVSSL